jgi:hypothetical protein
MAKQAWPPQLFRGPQSTAHPYPLQIALRAQIFTVGSIFYYAFVDGAVGEYLQQVEMPYKRIRNLFLTKGVTELAWEENWRAFEAYLRAFPNPVFQNALFGMVMHWDWYIAKLGKFVEFARAYVGGSILNKRQQSDLQRIAFKPISDQITILSEATTLTFGLSADILSNLREMDLVRNLGMHNQWAVSEYYRQHAIDRNREIGSLREIDIKELEIWQQAITSSIQATSTVVAKQYVNVPDFNAS